MGNESKIFLFALIFIIVFSISAVSADDLQGMDSGTVSGDVDVASVNPWTTSGQLTYDVPAEAKEIKNADLYVNVYSGSAQNTYGANANVSINTTAGEQQIASEQLWIEDGSSDGTVYTVNDHINKCYSDYQMHYDLTDTFKGLNGSSVSIKVDTFKMENKAFDGRIKLIALILAYDDGDKDIISYWVDSTQKWTKTNVTTTFRTEDVRNVVGADLINVALSSADGSYRLNGEFLGDSDNHTSGNYYQYNYWNVTDKIKERYSTELLSLAGTGTYSSIKNVLTILKIRSKAVTADVSLATEYKDTCFAGTGNVITIDVKADKAANYTVELLADREIVNSTVVSLDGENKTTVLLTDPTIRPIDETTVKGANNTEVRYAVTVKYGNELVGEVYKIVPVLYNGYLGKDMAYNATYIEDITVVHYTGNATWDNQEDTTYASAAVTNRTDIFEYELDENSTFAHAFVYLPYTWDKSGVNGPTFNLTFNGNVITPKSHFRDQSNLGSSGEYGYGLFVYDVSDLIQDGNNTLVLQKPSGLTAFYPSSIYYFLNDSNSEYLCTAYIANGADLLYNSYNKAERIVKTDSKILVDTSYIIGCGFSVFAAGAQKGEGNLIINGDEYDDIWNGSANGISGCCSIFFNISDVNEVSLVATGGTFLALSQVFIIAKDKVTAEATGFTTEYTKPPCIYAGTNNTFSVDVKADKKAKYTIELIADDIVVDSIVVALDGENKTTVSLTDPTIRPIDETTVKGANNTYVNYEVNVKYGDYIAAKTSKTLPVLYNGNFGYDMEYGMHGFNQYAYVIDGDVVIDVKDVSTYLGSGNMNRTDVWTVNLAGDSYLKEAIILVPYNWFDPEYNETADMFNVTFNGETINPILLYRDQGNVGNYGGYGYGLLIYKVGYLLNTSGDNTLVLNKKYDTPAVYPSTLIYLYNTPGGNFKEVMFAVGADLLANTNNKAGRTVKSDTNIWMWGTDYVNATLYVLAAGAQSGEGNLIVNGVQFTDVWNGTSSTTDLFVADITDIITKYNNISFVATGSNFVALPQIIVADAGLYFDINSIKTEFTSVPTIYAGTNNTLTVTVSSTISGEFGIDLWADGILVNTEDVNLTNGTTKLFITDPTIRPIDETTVNGANNTQVKYWVEISYGNYCYNDFITVPVLYNGYLGKDLEYNKTFIEDFNVIQFTGDAIFDGNYDSSYLGSSATERSDVWVVDLDENSTLVKAFVYLAYNWDKSGANGPAVTVTFNNKTIEPRSNYRDQSNLGGSGKNGYGLLVYDVTDLIQDGNNTLIIEKPSGFTAFYPSSLIYFLNDTGSKVLKTAYIADGADLLSYNLYNVAKRPVKTESHFDVDTVNIYNNVLVVYAAGAEAHEGNLIVNGVEYENVWNGSQYGLSGKVIYLNDTLPVLNEVSFVSTGGTILALNQILLTKKDIITAEASLYTEFKDTCFAGTNNVIAIEVKADKKADYTVELLSDGVVVNSTTVSLDGENKTTVFLTDPTVRPIDETTVYGADNTKVNYTVNVKYGTELLCEASKTVPVLYNGYLGKDMEYNATFIEDITVIEFTGSAVFEGKGESTYMNARDTERSDVWSVDLDENSTLVKAFVYLAYNTDRSGDDGPILNVTFNNKTVTPKAHYRDQSNLGVSAKSGYGLLVYDVTDLIQDGNNTLLIKKPDGLTAFFPSHLVYFFNTTGSKDLKTAYIADGADLLLNNRYNLANRFVNTDSHFDIDNVNIYGNVFMSYAVGGQGNVVINGVEYKDAWPGSPYVLKVAVLNLNDTLPEAIDVSFVSTGKVIVALNQILLTRKDIVTAEVSLSTEYKDTCFAGTVNVITIDVKADKKADYTVELLSDGVVVNSTTVSLDGENKTTVLLTDPTVRPIDETTVSGADNTRVNYTVNVKYGTELLCEASKTVPVLYNGYLGKDMEYNATFIENITVIHYTGSAYCKAQNETYAGLDVTNRTEIWTVDMNENLTLVNAFIYLAYNWDKSGANGPVFNLTFNNKTITPKAHYRDQSNLGNSGRYGYGLFIYDVTDLFENGNNTLVLQKPSGLTAFYPSSFVYLFNKTDSRYFNTAYILDGVDLLYNSYNKAQRIVKTDSQIVIDTNKIYKEYVVISAAGAEVNEGDLLINGVKYENVWNGTSNNFTNLLFKLDDFAEVNNISFVSTGKLIFALSQMIVTSREIVAAEVSLSTEYKDTCFAGTVNVISIDVKANKKATYTVELLADGDVVDSTDVRLDGVNKYNVLLTDPTVRPVDETTVSGANNTKVNYTVNVIYLDEIVGEASKTVPVLYNGYLGKDMEYNATYIEDLSVYVINGNFNINVKEDSTYAGADVTNRTDVWNVELPDSLYMVKAFVYLAYNWDKSGVNGPVFNVTFNNQIIAPKAHYRDQSNLGTSGRYGYGLFIYDVTDLVENGNNTLVLNKQKGLTAVYPSAFVYMTNSTYPCNTITVYVADGADLLIGGSYNKADRIVKTESQINVSSDEMDSAYLVVFAAGSQKGEGNIVFNGMDYEDVWNGTSNCFERYVSDISYFVSDSNNISFVSTASTILALSQFVVLTHDFAQSGFKDLVVYGNGTFSAVLFNGTGAIANGTIKYSINGVTYTTTTNDDGEFQIEAGSNDVVVFMFVGDGINAPTMDSVTLKDLAPTRLATQFNVTAGESIATYAVDYGAGERGANYKFQLTDSQGNPVANATVCFAYKTTYFNRTTDENGTVNLGISTQFAGEYLCALSYLGDETHNATFVPFSFNIQKKSITISASDKSFKKSAKTKKYTVTLKTQKGVDGKTYLKAGKKVTLKINGKTYTAKTNSKGQATFSIKLTKKGKFTAAVKFAGDNTYKSASKSVKITIK